MVIGEAPGRTEIAEGRPFCGPSGALLDQAFTLLSFDRADVYVTNVVKHMPTNEIGAIRRPTREEIEQWLPTFKFELARVCPGAVLLLGKTAAESWGWHPGLAEDSIYAAMHPAFVLRTMKEDPSVVDRWFDELTPFVRRVHELQAQI